MEQYKKIYLAGNISSNPETYAWRDVAVKRLQNHYILLNPAANGFNRKLINEAKGKPEEFLVKAITRSKGILISKDFQLVDASDIILVNLAIVNPDKPMIGTMFEMAWAWYLHKPIIAIISDNIYCKHPFPGCAISATTQTIDEACDLILEFFVE